MMDIQAAMGIQQLKKFSRGQKRREEIWGHYNQAFAAMPLQLRAPVEKNNFPLLRPYHRDIGDGKKPGRKRNS